MVPCTYTQKGKKSHIVALFAEKDSYTNLQIIIIIIINEESQGYNFQSIFYTSAFSFTSSASHVNTLQIFLPSEATAPSASSTNSI